MLISSPPSGGLVLVSFLPGQHGPGHGDDCPGVDLPVSGGGREEGDEGGMRWREDEEEGGGGRRGRTITSMEDHSRNPVDCENGANTFLYYG